MSPLSPGLLDADADADRKPEDLKVFAARATGCPARFLSRTVANIVPAIGDAMLTCVPVRNW